MKITLLQPEIVTAIRNFAEKQGINLRNKQLTVEFTSGRKENGLSAELTIEDISIPGDDTPATPVNVVTAPAPVAEAVAEIPVVAEVVEAAPAQPEEAPAPVEQAEAPVAVEETKTVSSLFGTP